MVDARDYHERTNYSLDVLEGSAPDPGTKPRPYKEYRDRPTVDLGGILAPAVPTLPAVAERRADPLADAEQPSPGGIDLETVATLCYEAAGVVSEVTDDRGGTVRYRAASCTGRLYHVDCYLVTGDVDGLDPGVYHFDPVTFALDRLREGDYRGTLAAATGDRSGETATTGASTAPVTVAVTSTWWRNAWGYADRTYRHAFWDSGTVLANLLAAAHALDYRAEVVAAFDDGRVAELLGIDPDVEAPLELVPVGAGDPVPEPTPVDRAAFERIPAGERSRDLSLIREAWRGSTLADGEHASSWRSRCRSVGAVGDCPGGDGERVPLDPVDHETASARPLHATIRRRRSCREYATAGPSRRQVGTVLDRATRGVPGDWNGGEGLTYNEAFVLATGVDGIPDGRYQYHPASAVFERLGDTSVEDKARIALGQDWTGAAHVNVYLLADVDGVVAELGNRGYRLAQLEAGITLGRLYLATYAHRDLGGTGKTFADDAVTEHCSPRAGGRSPTCMFAFGRRTG